MRVKPSSIAATLFVVLSVPSIGTAGEFDGWCFDGGGCTGTVAIRADEFPTCEETCQMKNQTKVSGMDAYLYDVECRGDSGNSSKRMMLVRFPDSPADKQGMMITAEEATPIFRCQ